MRDSRETELQHLKKTGFPCSPETSLWHGFITYSRSSGNVGVLLWEGLHGWRWFACIELIDVVPVGGAEEYTV